MLRVCLILLAASPLTAADAPAGVAAFLDAHCTSCHGEQKKGGLDLTALKFDPRTPKSLDSWVKVIDRVTACEMPPKKKLDANERIAFTDSLTAAILKSERDRIATDGRASQRRLNRREYENTLRDLLGLPWLQIEDALPEDGVAHFYSKSAEALDVSHVQMARYLAAADSALRQAIAPADRPPSRTVRYYARDQEAFTRKMFFSNFNNAPERATFPTLGFAAQPDVRSRNAPLSNPKHKDEEGIGLVCGAYEPIQPTFSDFKAPMSGRYKLRFNAHTVWVGPNGGSGNPQKNPKWFIPNFDVVSKGRRSEPIRISAEVPPRLLRELGAFDIGIEPAIHELDVYLLKGETIRPDAARFFRSRPGETRFQNPLAEADGQPGVVYRWMEVEGPITDSWPPPGHKLLFGDKPLKNPETDARRLLAAFAERAYRRPMSEADRLRFLPLIHTRLKKGASFTEAMLTGYAAVLCSTEFLFLHESPGTLNDHALATRLSLFLWDSEPDTELRRLARDGKLKDRDVLAAQTDRMLKDPKSARFVENFLDYWLDLRKIGQNAPDSTLYNDYYLDDLLDESILAETRLFFTEVLQKNLPVKTLIDSDFAMLNERLAKHYGLPPVDGVALRKTKLPPQSVRGGLLTQASVLTVTANGTTTSPVVRGAWIMDRFLGQPSPPPPPVPTVEPDLRGAVTIRDQLAKHRDQPSCAACHNRIDPPGFALESFDVMGGYRDKYRAIAEKNDREKGVGVNGQPFAFKHGLKVDCAGQMANGSRFKEIREFKKLLMNEERQVARNLVQQFIAYSTGAPAGFADRAEIEAILNGNVRVSFAVRGLIHSVVQSEMFRSK